MKTLAIFAMIMITLSKLSQWPRSEGTFFDFIQLKKWLKKKRYDKSKNESD
ncbi:MAG: hypothetical protein IPG09_11270 [Ignavibacteria bacterium]|nr:hypothetical protein [Ignavibacteria bacterium]